MDPERPDPAPHTRRILAPHAEEFEEAAASADILTVEDSARFLAAIARGEYPPKGVVQRIVERAKEE